MSANDVVYGTHRRFYPIVKVFEDEIFIHSKICNRRKAQRC